MIKNGKGFIRPTIRGLDPELYKRAKADAALQDKDIGAWMNEAIAGKLGLPVAPRKGKGQ